MQVATENKIIQDWIEYWSSHNMDKLTSLFTDDCVYEDVTMGVVNHGKQELKAFGEGFFTVFSDVKFNLQSSFVTSNWAGCEWIMVGTQSGEMPGLPNTGKSVNVRGASILQLQDGKITRCSDYWDMATLLKQLGLMPGA